MLPLRVNVQSSANPKGFFVGRRILWVIYGELTTQYEMSGKAVVRVGWVMGVTAVVSNAQAVLCPACDLRSVCPGEDVVEPPRPDVLLGVFC